MAFEGYDADAIYSEIAAELGKDPKGPLPLDDDFLMLLMNATDVDFSANPDLKGVFVKALDFNGDGDVSLLEFKTLFKSVIKSKLSLTEYLGSRISKQVSSLLTYT